MQKNPHIDRAVDFIAKFASNPSSNHNNLNQTAMETTVVEARQTRNMTSNENNVNNQSDATSIADNTTVVSTQEQTTMMEDEEFENEFLTQLIDYLIEVIIFEAFLRLKCILWPFFLTNV